MEIVTVEKLIEAHVTIIQEFGGARGILNRTLEYLVYKANLERDIFKKAALFIYCIGSKHPFIDGNKRTGFAAAELVLGDAGLHLEATDDEVVAFMVQVAQYECNPLTIELWLKERAEI
jgi:death-on-curing protein